MRPAVRPPPARPSPGPVLPPGPLARRTRSRRPDLRPPGAAPPLPLTQRRPVRVLSPGACGAPAPGAEGAPRGGWCGPRRRTQVGPDGAAVTVTEAPGGGHGPGAGAAASCAPGPKGAIAREAVAFGGCFFCPESWKMKHDGRHPAGLVGYLPGSPGPGGDFHWVWGLGDLHWVWGFAGDPAPLVLCAGPRGSGRAGQSNRFCLGAESSFSGVFFVCGF